MEKLSKFFEDKNFIHWVLEPDSELDTWWEQFQTDHPEEKNNILLARKILLKFRTTDKKLTEEERIRLFALVLKQIEGKKSGKTRRLITVLIRYAAVALLFFSIGALLFHKKNQFNLQYYAEQMTEQVPGNSAKLIRANGEDILLKEDKSVLQYQADGKLVVNKDTIAAGPSKPVTETAMNQLIIPYGKTSEVWLPDGTKVFLNAGSRMVYPENFSGKNREVFLVGEACFEVKHDQAHPFIVQLSDLRIKVLGTRFNVSAYQGDNLIETVLAEGKVSIERNNSGLFEKAIEMQPNELAIFDRTSKETSIRQVDPDNYILWTKGLLQVESTDLNRITKRLERFYNVRFRFTDPLLGGLRITGKLALKEDKDEICERLARAASVRIVKKEEGLYEILR